MNADVWIAALAPVVVTGIGVLLWFVLSGRLVMYTKVLEARSDAERQLREQKEEFQDKIRALEKQHDRDMNELQRANDKLEHENANLVEATADFKESIRIYQRTIDQNATVAAATRSVLSALHQPGLLGPSNERETGPS